MTAETTEATTRYLLEATRAGLDPVRMTLERVTDAQLLEQPVPEQLPVGKMIEHVYGAVAFTSRSIRLGKCEESDVADLMTDNEATGTRPRIEQVAEAARAETESALAALTPEAATRQIDYWFGWSLSGLETARLGFQELCHHRGQLQSFLRLIGVEPVDVNAPSEPAEAPEG